ncbi:Tat proofreading chaperone DmsD [Enterobacter kobei]|jgi:TorA maturation chaperone TorD|uniref:Tat proofreading chaperone DmsD n=1 Tax=Enterobacter kobei TaxID=208224 RepID=A0AA86JA14_9ENTR|nr:Tat proofreading chaperone DmsD [Enterobacter kobei]BCU55779.1 Tat proofreading chaperone DmsD [Enterobacter kobei]SIR75848.1 chaperone TorD involved in molybdoenzyme TorA maturation [Enterobacter kobei]
MDDAQRQAFAVAARVLGALFYYPPQSEQAAPLVAALQDPSWQAQWPLPSSALSPLAERFRAPADEPLPEAWQRLFLGPWALPAPPWGSVWLDRENVLFGDSTLALRQWMRDNQIVFAPGQNEPEDHIGTLLMMAAWLLEENREAECEQLLAWHLLPWAGRWLAVFGEHAAHPFYEALGELTRLTLAAWQTQLLIPVAEKTLYK